MSDLRTIILAAGKGTRMKSASPKVLHEVCGKALIDYVVDIAEKVGSLKTYVVLGHQSEKVKPRLAADTEGVLQKKLLGTADAVQCARSAFKHFRGDVLILCGDTVLLQTATVKQLIQRHRRTKAAATFLTATVHDAFGYGRVIRDGGNKVLAIREEKDATFEEKQVREINVGVYCFKASALAKFIGKIKINDKKKEFYLTDIIELLARNGLTVETTQTDDAREGLGINTREDLALATAAIRERIIKNFLNNGVTVVDPSTTFIYADVQIGRDTVIRPFTFIENNVRIGTECVIGPFAHLRPGVRLGHKVEIGNFAEVSRSKLGNNCLQKHFSFVGDAEVGSHVNIGAGVVTANYDGKNKNKTKIGNRAFIGSDSILVAPVVIGEEAVTGAGCVVTKGKVIPRRGIAMGVPARVVTKK